MGVPGFFIYVRTKYPMAVELMNAASIKSQCDNLFIDLNACIHDISHSDNDFALFLPYEVIASKLIVELDRIIGFVNPQKLLFLAVDGTVPRSKMNQQRERRFVSAKEQAASTDETKLENAFDSNCISPGTEFMEKISEIIEYYISEKLSSDPVWKKRKVVYSSHRHPGEGEYKILDYLRQSIAVGTYDDNDRNILFGVDADLILLALTLHKKNVIVMRNSDTRIRNGRNVDMKAMQNDSFFLIHSSILGEFLEADMSERSESWIQPDMKPQLIDDFVFLMAFCGNDFLPQIPFFNINDNCIQLIIGVYSQIINENKQLIMLNNKPKMDMIAKILNAIKTMEESTFISNHSSYLKSLKTISAWNLSQAIDENASEALKARKDKLSELNDIVQSTGTNLSFSEYRTLYYQVKLDICINDINDMRTLCSEYYKGLCWIMKYYNEGICSWNWVYPYHYSPFASDIAQYIQMHSDFDMSRPFTPFQHLLCCLPPHSSCFLPPSYARLLASFNSPLSRFYPQDFATDLNGKMKAYEAVVILPFIKEEDVLQAVIDEKCDESLTESEIRRNTLEPMFLFKYCDSARMVKSPLMQSLFPDVSCFSSCEAMETYDAVFRELSNDDTRSTYATMLSSLYPLCTSIRHSEQKQSKTDRREKFQLTKMVRSIVEVDTSDISIVNSATSLTIIGKKWIGSYVDYGYPLHRIGLVMALYSYDFYCECRQDGLKSRDDCITSYKMNKDKKMEIKSIFESIKKRAFYGNAESSYEIGNLDIDDANILLVLRPVYHIARNQLTTAAIPFFASQYMFYPMILSKIMKIPNILGGRLTLREFAPYSVRNGDRVIYVGDMKVGGRSIYGHVGEVVMMNKEVITVRLQMKAKKDENITGCVMWYSENDVIKQLPQEYQSIAKYCMECLFVKKLKKINIGMDLFHSSLHLIREGLTRTKKEEISEPAVLAVGQYSLLSTNFTQNVEENKGRKRPMEYSESAIVLMKQYFDLFGKCLMKCIVLKKRWCDVNPQLISEDTVQAIVGWIKSHIAVHAFLSENTMSASPDYIKSLIEHDRTGENVIVEIECSQSEILIRENQNQIVSDLVLKQSIPSVCSRIVVVQHPTIPFGATGTVIAIDMESFWMTVVLDEAVIAGVGKSNSQKAESSFGKEVYLIYFCDHL